MSFAFDLYTPSDSWLHRLDPRVKIWATLLGMVAGILVKHLVVLALLLLGVHMLLLAAGISRSQLRWLWARMAPVTVLILLIQPWLMPGQEPAWLGVGPLQLTRAGLLEGASFALRANALAFVAAMLLFTTDQSELVRGLVRLGLPYTLGLTISLALRYLPTSYGLFVEISEAQQARGWQAGGQGGVLRFVRQARGYLPVLVAMVIAALRMSDALALALAARGLGAGRRTVWQEIRFRESDWIALGATTVAFIGFLYLRLAQGFGAKPW